MQSEIDFFRLFINDLENSALDKFWGEAVFRPKGVAVPGEEWGEMLQEVRFRTG